MTFLSFESQMDKAGSTESQEGLFLHWNKELPTPIDGMSATSPPIIPIKKKTTRRAGSCEPCRKSKIKCDGRRPECTGCSKRKRAKCKDPCQYIPAKERSAASRRQQMMETSEQRATSPLSVISEGSDESDDEDSSPNAIKFRGPPMSYGSDDFFGAFSLARSIDKFKLMCARPAGVKLPDVAAQCNGIEAFDALPFPKPIEDHELLISRPQHSLSHYLPSTDLDLVPEIRDMGWKAINMKEKMIDDGRMHEAYKDFPGLAREARFFRGLNIKPKTKASSRTLQVQVEQKIYRLIVDMDIRICTHLGMPLEVQPDKIPPTTTFTATDADPWVSELEKSQSEFRQLAFDILSLLPSVSEDDEVTTSPRILEDLSLKWDQLRELCSEDPSIPDTPGAKALFVEHLIDRRALSILLGCILGDQRSRWSNIPGDNTPDPSQKRNRDRLATGDEYTEAVLEAAQDILSLFASLGSLSDDCAWTCAYAVFCAAAISSIAILHGTYHPAKLVSLKNAVGYFGRATRQRGKGYGLVAAPLTRMWTHVQAAARSNAEKRRGNRPAEASSPVTRSETKHNKKSPTVGCRKRQHDTTDDEIVEQTVKRTRRSPRVTRASVTPTALTFGQEMMYSQSQHHPTATPYRYDGAGHVWNANFDISEPSSANVSFSSAAALDAPITSIQEEFPLKAPDGHEYHWCLYHPPQLEPQPPYHHRDPKIPNPHYNNTRFYQWKDPEYLADTSPGRPVISTPGGRINAPIWQMTTPNDGMAVPMYSNMPQQESRRGSVISQHDYNTATHQGWPEHNAALSSGTHMPQLHPGYSTGVYYDNNVTPVMTNAANWMNSEQYHHDEDVTEDESTWQQEQGYSFGQQPLSLGCGL